MLFFPLRLPLESSPFIITLSHVRSRDYIKFSTPETVAPLVLLAPPCVPWCGRHFLSPRKRNRTTTTTSNSNLRVVCVARFLLPCRSIVRFSPFVSRRSSKQTSNTHTHHASDGVNISSSAGQSWNRCATHPPTHTHTQYNSLLQHSTKRTKVITPILIILQETRKTIFHPTIVKQSRRRGGHGETKEIYKKIKQIRVFLFVKF